MYKHLYSLFLDKNKGIQHYACHSHHYWPDVTRAATIQYWDDSAQYVDDKWDYCFEHKLPRVQQLIANNLNLSYPEQIAFAPNTHEFVARIISCFDPRKTINVLTTDSEFYSFDRQINRLIETGIVNVKKVPTMPFDTFEERFKEEIKKADYDLVFFSHVFFNSGIVTKNFQDIVATITNPDTIIVMDGYHGFMAVPTDLSSVENRMFYIAGGYKYAQAGEGCCFMYAPKGANQRPLYTGWYAGFGALKTDGGNTGYSDNGMRFAGSTMDYAALYRMEASLSLFKQEGLTVEVIHNYVQKMQENFKNYIATLNHDHINLNNLLQLDSNHHGHFFTFALENDVITGEIYTLLKENGVWTDYRGNRLRFGFAIYQNDCINLDFLKK